MENLSRDAVEKLEKAHLDALLAHDLDELDRMYSNDFIHVHYDGRRDDKATFMAPLRSGAVRYTGFDMDAEPQVRLIGDTAVVSGVLNWTAATSAGESVTGTIVYTSVWSQHAGRAVQVAWHSSPHAAKDA